MNNVNILDCTLRDGGYVNNFSFGRKNIRRIITHLSDANIEIVEVGFLKSGETDKERSLFGSVVDINEFVKVNDTQTMFVAMIAYGDISLDEIDIAEKTVISGIRLTFHETEIDESLDFAKGLMQKGYEVFIQPVGTAFYTDEQLLKLVEKVNQAEPFAFYIVDTLGSMYENDLLRMFYLINRNLSTKIRIGFHAHNNLQLAFSNAQKLIGLCSKRELIIDSSLLGMGRGAGNLCTELITRYINENIVDKYNITELLEALDQYIRPIKAQYEWGYSIPYYLAATKNCHPNYATYLMNQQTLCVKDIDSILKSLPDEQKHLYDKEVIKKLYIDYQEHSIDDMQTLEEIKNLCENKNILILAPGRSLITYRETIVEYIKEKKPIVFAINHIPEMFDCDRVFIGNLKRFKSLHETIATKKNKIIFMSNITTDRNLSVINYSDYLNENEVILDNTGLMIINLFRKIGINSVALAGYDGFSFDVTRNYCDANLINNVRYEDQVLINGAIIDYFKKIRRVINVEFITPTIYDSGDIIE